jgi:hypothetical protein
MKVPQFTLYAKNAGVEISAYEKRTDNKPSEGRISLRFFKMESKAVQIRFVAEPWESFELFRKIDQVYREGGKEAITHKFAGKEGEVITKLAVEKYERNNKPGYALIIQRGTESINVSASEGHFLYAGELLRHLATAQAWVEQPEQTAKTKE